MPNRQNKRAVTRRKELIQEFDCKCENCHGTENLEFAHTGETPLSSIPRGRGRKERVYDVIKHPDKYKLLCKDCHKMYDMGVLQ